MIAPQKLVPMRKTFCKPGGIIFFLFGLRFDFKKLLSLYSRKELNILNLIILNMDKILQLEIMYL